MYGLLQDGPCAHQHIWVADDEPPEVTTVEPPVTGDDWLVPIPPGGEFPEAKFESHTYRSGGRVFRASWRSGEDPGQPARPAG
jgi:hypothetical protein